MSDVELRELRYFVAVAQELHFGRAARRLGMAQPPLSRAIQILEDRLGVPLLERTTRQVRLTPAGEVLLEQAAHTLAAAEATVTRTRQAGAVRPEFVVAAKAGPDDDLLRAIVAGCHGNLPPVTVMFDCPDGQAAAVHSGAADVALLRSPFDLTGLDAEVLVCEPRMAVLPASHQLARRGRLRRADLAGERTPQPARPNPTRRAYWAGLDPESGAATEPTGTGPEPGGDEPVPKGPVVSDIPQLLALVALGQTVAFVSASTARSYPRNDLAYIIVTDLSPSKLVVAWPQASRSRAVAAFVGTANAIATSLNGPASQPPTDAPAQHESADRDRPH
jgi:DNA-binding transcriptional LysR family regulator